MISGLIVSAIVPFLIARFGGMAISAILLKAGVSQAVAKNVAPQLASILAKLAGKQPLSPEEQAALAAHAAQTKTQEVAAHPGSPFRPV